MIRRLLFFCLLPFAFCISSFANDLSVDRHSLRTNESVTITLSLEDDFAGIDNVRIPVRNLTLEPGPSVSREFSYINGTAVRRTVFRYRARPVSPGPAVVGPLTIAAGALRETLPAVALQIMPDAASASNDPSIVLRELLTTERDPLFVIAEVDKTTAFAGEQIVVTWWLYNGTTVNQWQIGSIPKLNDFWVEELDVRNTQPVSVYVGAYMLQKVPIRRVALYPLRSGSLEIGPMEIEAALVRRTSSFGGLFDRFEGSLVEISYTSAKLNLDVKPLPPGTNVSAVGDFSMRCNPPLQKNGGPVVLEAVLSGRGNARAAAAPQFARPPAADVQIVDSGVSIEKRAVPSMTRKWRFLMSPRENGTLSVPALELPVFSPSTGSRQMLRCEGASLSVVPSDVADEPAVVAETRAPATPVLRISLAVLAGLAVAAAMWFFVWPWWNRRRHVLEQLRALTVDPAPAAIREAVHAKLEANGLTPADLLREPTIRGEAYRSLRSLLDALERDRIEVDDRQREIRRRLRDLLVA